MSDQPLEDAADAMATTLASVRRQSEGMEGLHSTLVRSVNVEDFASQADLRALGRISVELGRMQRRWEGSIDIEIITSGANVEVLQWLRDNDPGLTKLAVCAELFQGIYGRDVSCYCPSAGEDLAWAGIFAGNNKNLRELVVNDSIFAELSNSLPKFFAGVSRNRSIRGIEFDRIDLSNGDVLEIMEPFFENNANLRHVKVDTCQFGGAGDRNIASMLRSCQTIEQLYLMSNLGDGEQPTRIIAAVRTHTELKYLRLDIMNVGSNECRSLAALPCFLNLQELNLMGNNIDDDGVEALMGALANGNSLRWLTLSHNPLIATRGLQSIADALENPITTLEELRFLWNGVDDEGAEILARALANNHTLRILALVASDGDNRTARRHRITASDNRITARGWQAFDNILCNTASIEATYQSNHTLAMFSRNGYLPSIGDEGGGAAILSSLVFSSESNQRGPSEGAAARRKIIKHHLSSDEGMGHFAGMDRTVLPRVLAWVPNDELLLLYRVVRNWQSEIIGFVNVTGGAPAGPQA